MTVVEEVRQVAGDWADTGMFERETMRRIWSVLFLTFVLLAPAVAQSWQQSASPSVRLGIRDFSRTPGPGTVAYVARFEVFTLKGERYISLKHVPAGGEWGTVSFPEDFRVFPSGVTWIQALGPGPGKYRWVALVEGEAIAGGEFEYRDRFEVRVGLPTPEVFAATLNLWAVIRARTEPTPMRIAKAQADARTLVSAISRYSATFGALPASLSDLTEKRTINGVTGGPFLWPIPIPPSGWSEYRYTARPNGTFLIEASGDGTAVSLP